ncbi:hypothetical protein [Paraburkholderia youngii]|uniref:hypothetical protein n=1 Tax=Paraburkholderia youngii TaxID=2782701 RepID=UPI003D22AA3F
MTRSNTEPPAVPFGSDPSDNAAPVAMDFAPAYPTLIYAPPGSGRSTLDLYLKATGRQVVAGPVHTDGPEEFAQAASEAHKVQDCLPTLHDTVLEATGKSLDDNELLKLVGQLPKAIADQIEEWGLADTEVNTQIHHHLKQESGVARG